MSDYRAVHSKIPYSQIRALQLLRTYRFLTIKQLVRVGLAKGEQGVRDVMRGMRPEHTEKPFVNVIDHGFFPGHGRLPILFFMTDEGAKALAEIERISVEEIGVYKAADYFGNDYFHRVMAVDFHIAAEQFCAPFEPGLDLVQQPGQGNYRLSRFDTYFTYTGSNRGKNDQPLVSTAKIKFDDGKHLIPDAIMEIDTIDGRRSSYFVEFYNSVNPKRIEQQLRKHVVALGTGAQPLAGELATRPLVLSVFPSERALLAIFERLRPDPAFRELAPYFGFTSLNNAQIDFANRWLFLDGKTRSIVPEVQHTIEEGSLFVSDIIKRFDSPSQAA